MSKNLERWLTLLGTIASLILFVDTYVFKSKIATALRLPAEVPTGLFLAVVLVVCIVALVLLNRLLKHASRAASSISQVVNLHAERDQLATELRNEREQHAGALKDAQHKATVLQEQLEKLHGTAAQKERLENQVIALLEARSLDERRLKQELGIGSTDSDSVQLLREVVGDLVRREIVQARPYGLGDYELRDGWQTKAGKSANQLESKA